MPQERILVIDDEPLNLALVEEYLASVDVGLDLETGPLAARKRLDAHGADYSVVVLDCQMPGLGGLDLLRHIKADGRLADIPVILQTAAASPGEVREGLAAGAYYYLTKPYDPESLVSIIRVALEGHRARMHLRDHIARLDQTRQGMTAVEYRFATLDDIDRLVPVLAALCPAPDAVAPGLADLMVNAVEHGNLGISYQEKAHLKRDGDWEAEIRRRLVLPGFRERYGTVRWERRDDRILFTISDQGEGFDWTRYLDFDPVRAFDPNGRGIALARAISFSSLEYQGRGNVVVASVPVSG